ncbi:MAG: hypothetical protein LBG29_08645 [Synergistaceae bacterium]|nr:hypothetical protein [Synergistaceae bacterium]
MNRKSPQGTDGLSGAFGSGASRQGPVIKAEAFCAAMGSAFRAEGFCSWARRSFCLGLRHIGLPCEEH